MPPGRPTKRKASGTRIMNAAAAIYVSGNVASYAEGVAAAQRALDAGAALAALHRLKAAYDGS